MTSDSASSTGLSRLSAVRLLIVLIGVLLLGSLARLLWIDRLPGIDGDEAWYGVNIHVFLDGGVPFWKTGVGNSLNPFHSLPLLGLSYVMTTTGTLLRAPEVIWGLLATAIAYPLFAGVIGRGAALLVTLLLALSPTAIAYSRFGWDPSGTPLACLLGLGFACRQQPIAAALACLAAIAIHPTNVFFVPIVSSAFAPGWWKRYVAANASTRRRLRLGAVVLVALGAPLALWALNVLAERPNTPIPSVEMVLQRAFSLAAWGDSARGVLRLFSGATTVADIAGPLPRSMRTTLDLVAVAVLALPVLVVIPRLRGAQARPPWLLGGFVVSFVVFHIVAGPTALVPGRERYGLLFLIPEIVLYAIALDALAASRPRLARAAIALTIVSFTTLTVAGYFLPLLLHGGNARAGLRTGPVEPKVAAFEFLKADAGSAEVIEVIADDWYLYWPMRYLAGRDKRFHVELIEGANAPGGVRPAGAQPQPYPHAPDRVYALVFDDDDEWLRLTAMGFRAAFTAVDPIGRPILHVVRLQGSEFIIQR